MGDQKANANSNRWHKKQQENEVWRKSSASLLFLHIKKKTSKGKGGGLHGKNMGKPPGGMRDQKREHIWDCVGD